MLAHAIARARPRPTPGTTAAQLAAGLVVAGASVGLTVALVGLTTVKGAALLLVVAGALWFAFTRRSGLALALLMLYLGGLDGYLKLASGSSYVTFIRDVLLYAFVVGLLVRAAVRHQRFSAPPLSAWVVAFVVLVLVQLANPQDGSIVHSLAGVRQHLEFVPLFFLTFALVRTKKTLRGFAILLAVLAAANGLADVVQFNESPQQLASWGPGYAQRVLGQGGFSAAGRAFFTDTGQLETRPFGLQSDAGSGGLVCVFALGAILALASLPTTRRYVLPAAAIGVAAVAGIVTAQGRSVVVSALAVVLAYAILTATSRRALSTVIGVALLGSVAFVAVHGVTSGSQAPVLRYQGLSASNIVQTTDQARGKSLAKLPKNLANHPFGAGLGVAGPATGVSGAQANAGVLDAENEFSFATIETGIPGMLAIVGFTLALVGVGIAGCRRELDPEVRLLLAAIVAPLAGVVVLYFVSATTPTTPGGPYLWAAGGIVSYWLLARPRQRRTEEAPLAGSE